MVGLAGGPSLVARGWLASTQTSPPPTGPPQVEQEKGTP